MARLPTLRSLHPRLRSLIKERGTVGMLHFYVEPRRSTDVLARCVEDTLRGQLGSRFREEDLLARGGDGAEWFVFLVSPPRSRQGLTRRDLQEVERRVARELRARIRESLPLDKGDDLPPLRSGAAVLEHDPRISLAVQLEEARHEARLHGLVSRLLDDQISGLNHKIRTPLTTIKGVIEILRDDPQAARSFLTPLEKEVNRIQRLLTLFSLVTRVQSGLFDWDMREVDLNEVVSSAVRALHDVASEYGVGVELKLPKAPLRVLASPEILEEAVRQLVDNAIRHGARGKWARVEVRGHRADATVDVVDHGPGIPAEDLPQLYQPFYVVGRDPDTQAQGGGLGLCLARGVVELHGGELSCESEVGRGTTMQMRIPRLKAR